LEHLDVDNASLTTPTLFWEDITHTGGVKTPLVWLDELNVDTKVGTFQEITTKGPWGRPLTKYAKCNINQTVYLDCTPLLECYTCSSTNETGCFNQSNMIVTKCSEDVLRCYKFKREKADGTFIVEHGCMDDKIDSKKTCSDLKKSCNRDSEGGDKTCFCRDCFGKLCNGTPMYKVVAEMTNAITGSMSGIMYMIDKVSELIRVGMYDTSLLDKNTTAT